MVVEKVKIEYRRPEKIKGYIKQVEFMDAPSRFTVVEATTKAGKTVGCIVWLYEQAISEHGGFYVDKEGNLQSTTGRVLSKDGFNYWWVAPTYKVAKIAFRRFKRYMPKDIFTANESELTLTLVNGAIIFFKSGDDPDGLYGEDVYGVVLDEATRMKEDSWIAVFSTLTATEGVCKIIGNVKGNNNWVYRLARETETGQKQNWSYFKITADDAVKAGVLKQAVIDEAQRTLPQGIFLELYYGIPFINSSNKFAYAFDIKKHVKKCTINYDYPIYLSFDFNKNPICCSVIQYYNETVFIPFVIKLENSDIYKLCQHIKTKFTALGRTYNPDIFIVNGDASGNNKSAMVKDNLNYFRIIKAELDLTQGQMQQLASNPKIEENQVLVNAVLEHVKHCIDPDGAQPLISDLQFAEMLPDGTLKKADRNDPNQQLDPLDTYRYFINRNLRHFLRGHR
jgi:hypothetical protein